ncbi:helix-turn-helix domain-containing protein [Streptomyces sp. NA04227]|uniref:helix-turn-helix domain-containing protein n=1 Tax=Streptomyces sp. NA04227 TaxID=2742136 RepID=UPI001591EE7B|nr:helix-turn-helix transcriptional regulator [Streptomyces sp. NA04227]QKW07040.1 helix-turn-helix domain-containing protein [Streptomyces sp. NA04227]
MARLKLPPTIRQRRLGAELRRLREQAELSATAAGQLLGQSQSSISNTESGNYPVSAERVRVMARAYMCTDETLIEALASYTGGRTRGWWDEYRDMFPASMLDLAELEHHATSMWTITVLHIPGPLQTRDHAHALMTEALPNRPPHEIEHRVSFRIKRQAVLYGARPAPYTAIVHEAALRMGFGGPRVARAQLEHLLAMSERKNIKVAVVPFGAGTFSIAGHGITNLGGEVPHLDTIQIDTDTESEFRDTQVQLDWYRQVFTRIQKCALDEDESRGIIRRIAQSI